MLADNSQMWIQEQLKMALFLAKGNTDFGSALFDTIYIQQAEPILDVVDGDHWMEQGLTDYQNIVYARLIQSARITLLAMEFYIKRVEQHVF